MNKREIVHALIDQILDVEESSNKGAHFVYSTGTGLDIRFCSRPHAFADRIADTHYGFTIDTEEFVKATSYIEKIKNIPDTEPKISILLTESEAREKGLIA